MHRRPAFPCRRAAAALALAAPALATMPAAAQIGNPAGQQAGVPAQRPGQPLPGQPNAQDRLFAVLMTSGGLGEVQAGRLAAAQGARDDVKAFGERMARVHAAANAKLASAATPAGIVLPTEPAPEHRGLLEQLQPLRGAAFDGAYLQHQLIEHQKAVQLLLWEISNGQDPDLQRHAAATLPEVIDHLASVQRLIAARNGTAPQGLAAAADDTASAPGVSTGVSPGGAAR